MKFKQKQKETLILKIITLNNYQRTRTWVDSTMAPRDQVMRKLQDKLLYIKSYVHVGNKTIFTLMRSMVKVGSENTVWYVHTMEYQLAMKTILALLAEFWGQNNKW